jgi:hypothetical protein
MSLWVDNTRNIAWNAEIKYSMQCSLKANLFLAQMK